MPDLPSTQPNTYSEALRADAPAVPRRSTDAVVDMIHAHPERPHTTASLARHAGVSVRTLQKNFRRQRATTVTGLLREVRLQRAHAELLAATPESVTVTEVAHRYEFFHQGHFARLYRERFGELPSGTLRR